MTEYLDWRCGDDLDAYGRDARPLEVLAQDIYHLLITEPMSLVMDPSFGFGLGSYLGKPLPSTLAGAIENRVRRDDRIEDAKCVIAPTGELDSYLLDLKATTTAGFLALALAMTPSGIVRVAA